MHRITIGSLAPSGTSSTKFILKSTFFKVGNVLLKGTLKMLARKNKFLFMEYVV